MANGTKCFNTKRILGDFKDTNWNKDIKIMPKYSVLEVCLEDKIDFENKETMTAAIIDKSIFFALEVQRYIENIK